MTKTNAVKKYDADYHEGRLIKDGISIGFELVSPEAAAQWLTKNTNNRRFSHGTAEYYKRQMTNNQWQTNGETIKFAVNGTIIDGQHRLTAISQGEISIWCIVVRGLPNEVLATVDTGKTRTPGDHLKVQGFGGESHVLAAACKVAMAFDKDGRYAFKSAKLSPSEIIDWIEGHKDIEFSMERVPSSVGAVMSRSVAVGLHYIFSMLDQVKTEQFFDQLASGHNLSAGHPVLALRTKLFSTKAKSRDNASRRQVVAYVVQAFKAFLDTREIQQVSYRPDLEIVLEGLPENMGKRFWNGK